MHFLRFCLRSFDLFLAHTASDWLCLCFSLVNILSPVVRRPALSSHWSLCLSLWALIGWEQSSLGTENLKTLEHQLWWSHNIARSSYLYNKTTSPEVVVNLQKIQHVQMTIWLVWKIHSLNEPPLEVVPHLNIWIYRR